MLKKGHFATLYACITSYSVPKHVRFSDLSLILIKNFNFFFLIVAHFNSDLYVNVRHELTLTKPAVQHSNPKSLFLVCGCCIIKVCSLLVCGCAQTDTCGIFRLLDEFLN